MTEPFIESSFQKEDVVFERGLRPDNLDCFTGQEAIKERLEILIQAAKQRGDVLPHALFSGPPGLGKTTLATILSKAMGTNLIQTSGPILEKPGDLAGVLTHLKEGDILFIDEIHRMNKSVEEYLYSAMEDFSLDLMIDSGPHSRSVQIKLAPFTLAAATTRQGLLSAPLRSRFGFSAKLSYYDEATLVTILERSSTFLSLSLEREALFKMAERSRGTPRIANNLLRWIRDFKETKGRGLKDVKMVEEALSLLAIDKKGLDETDIKILEVLIDHYKGKPVGLSTLAVAVGEEKHTVEEVHEPYLILQGFLKRTPRGREATPLAFEHLGRESVISLV